MEEDYYNRKSLESSYKACFFSLIGVVIIVLVCIVLAIKNSL